MLKPFYRTDKSRSRKHGGVGLGLTLCAQIAALHHAELFIDSQPEEGTIVTVVFTAYLHHPDKLIKKNGLECNYHRIRNINESSYHYE